MPLDAVTERCGFTALAGWESGVGGSRVRDVQGGQFLPEGHRRADRSSIFRHERPRHCGRYDQPLANCLPNLLYPH